MLLALIGMLKKKDKKASKESDEAENILPHIEVAEEPLPIRRKQTPSMQKIAKFFLPVEKQNDFKQKKG
ncbi:MAG: hypothetical protein M1300_11055 [Epsilonproteobacteria bacterium]|nr:hypothetical protein [Campylobacterota bacterium]